MSENLKQIYERLCNTKSDINEHLPTLRKYGNECDHITEMGVRYIVSTYALLMGEPKTMISYDIMNCDWVPVQKMVEDVTDYNFLIGDTLQIEIDETDLLFIDTLHNYKQLKKELEKHAGKVRKYIIFHDTTSFENIGESYTGQSEKGIWTAIEEFLSKNSHWKVKERFTNNNGLTIIEKGS
jgi:hypothetical protein